MRYHDRPHGLKEIAERLDLSISAITTIERKAMEKLQRKLKRQGITKGLISEEKDWQFMVSYVKRSGLRVS